MDGTGDPSPDERECELAIGEGETAGGTSPPGPLSFADGAQDEGENDTADGGADISPDRDGDGRGCPPGTNRGGGPKTSEGLARATANLQPHAAVTHGVHAFLRTGSLPPCGKCPCRDECPFSAQYEGPESLAEHNPEQLCVIMHVVYQEELDASLAEEHLAGRAVYRFILEERARLAGAIAKARLVLGQTGLIVQTARGPRASALMESWRKWLGTYTELGDKMGLTVRSGSQLSLDFASDAMVEVSAAIEKAHGKYVEGEYEVQDN